MAMQNKCFQPRVMHRREPVCIAIATLGSVMDSPSSAAYLSNRCEKEHLCVCGSCDPSLIPLLVLFSVSFVKPTDVSVHELLLDVWLHVD